MKKWGASLIGAHARKQTGAPAAAPAAERRATVAIVHRVAAGRIVDRQPVAAGRPVRRPARRPRHALRPQKDLAHRRRPLLLLLAGKVAS